MNPFDYIKSINSKNYLEDLSGFNLWITFKVYSVDPSYVFAVNAINLKGIHKLPKRAVYDFFFYTIPKNRKWLKYPKSTKELKQVSYIMEWFGCNEMIAKDYYELLEKEELKEICNYFEKRGMK